MTSKTQTSQSNALGAVTRSIQTFDLTDLQQYTREKSYATTASKDFHLFYVGRDDVHDILKHVLSRVSISLYLNMFGFDDDELSDILMAKAKDPHVMMMITLDKSQAGGEGSTNWSASGEGTFVVKGQPGGKGYKAQNNTQGIFTDPDTISRFQSELIAEHMAARVQTTGNAVEGAYRKGHN